MQVFGHRGAAGEAPENTLAGIRHAIDIGVRHIEIDLRLTLDHQLAVLHDRNLKRTAGLNKTINELRAAELSSTDASAGFNNWRANPDCAVPTLAGLLQQTPELECIQLEIKSDDSTDASAIVAALAAFFPDAASARHVIATSFDAAIIAALAARAPHIRRGIVAKRELPAALATAKKLGCDFLCLHYKLITACSTATLESLATSGLHISCWTVNGPRIANALAKRGVHSIITDIPTKLLPHVQKINESARAKFANSANPFNP